MKILEVTNLGCSAGGAETSVRSIRDELRRRGHKVRVLSSDIRGEKMFCDYTFKRIRSDSFFALFHRLFYLPSYRAVQNAVKDFRPDIIHFHTTGLCSPSVLFAIKKTPAVMTVHGPEEFTADLLPWLFSPNYYKDNPFCIDSLTLAGKLRYCYHRFFQRPVYLLGLRRIRRFIAPSKFMAKTIRRDVPKNKIEQIYNGIELPARKPLPDNQNILFVGRLEKVKGADYLLRALPEIIKSFPKARLTIVGDGPYRGELEKMTARLGLENNVVFRGWISDKRAIIGEYENALLLAMPSIWPEAMGLVCIEAFAVGRPVVAARTGGIPELVEDGKTGNIVPIKDAGAISKAIINLLSRPEIIASMSEAAVRRSQDFGIAGFIDKIEDLYKRASLS